MVNWGIFQILQTIFTPFLSTSLRTLPHDFSHILPITHSTFDLTKINNQYGKRVNRQPRCINYYLKELLAR